MMISCNFYDEKQVLSGTPELLSKYYTLFKSVNTNYEVTDTGVLNYIGETATYYVGGPGANDYYSGSDAGSSDHPFATVYKALIKNESNSCVILLQSDITEQGYLYARGNVIIKSKGTEKHKITVGSNQSSFIINDGFLFLGDSANQDPEDTLVIDGNLKSMSYAVIYNNENVNMNSGVTITGFKTDILLDNNGTFHMYGGTISSNTSNYIMYNEDYKKAFQMSGGEISNNTVGNCLISPGVNEISGGTICSNTSINSLIPVYYGTFLMTGGTISNNTAPSAINVSGNSTLQMSGGTISKNTGYGIQSDGTVQMTGGTISGNVLGGIYMRSDSENRLQLSGNLSITSPASVPGIYLDGSYRSIAVTGTLKNTEAITVSANSYAQDNPILTGDPAVIKENRDKFALTDTNYEIDESGYLTFKGDSKTYYVNEASKAAVSDGSIDTPFKTIPDAVAAIGMGEGTIILQSNITLNSTIVIRGTVNLTGDGNGSYTILHGSSYTPYSINEKKYNQMLVVYGKLAIGNKDNSQSDENPSLIIDGGSEEEIGPNDEILLNQGTVEIYSGVSLQHNVSSSQIYECVGGIRNCGKLRMYGGRILYNYGERAGGIFMESGSSFLMEGGSILSNFGYLSGGVYLEKDCTFTMNGGTVKGNGGYQAGGICMNGGSFTMNGGCISQNTGIVGGLNANTSDNGIAEPEAALTLNGGNISENTGSSLITNTNTKIPGIAVGKNVKFQMSKDIQITEGDQIAFFKDMGITGIEITGALTGENITAAVAVYESLQLSEYYTPVLTSPFGLQLLVSVSGYSFTQGDADRFTLVIPASETQKYAINAEGRVGKRLEEGWINITNDTGIISDGTQKTVNVTVTDGTTTYTSGVDYKVAYINNIEPGHATVIITGIGNYAGTFTKAFLIQPKPVQEPEATATPSPGLQLHTELGTDGTLHVDVGLSGEESGTLREDRHIPASEELLKQISGEEVERVNIKVQVPDTLSGNNQERNPGLILDAGLLEAAKNSGKQINVTVKDKDGKECYTWSFDGKKAASGKEITDFNLYIKISSVSENKALSGLLGDRTGLILSFSHEGDLPEAASVRIYVGDRKGIEPRSKIYLYHYNEETGRLETLPYSSQYAVDEDGYITIHIVHCSDYVMLTKKADSKVVTSLKDQIKVSPLKKTLYAGGTKGSHTTIKVELPETLKQVATLSDETSSGYIGGVTISFKSGNKKVASVSKTGEVKAVGAGKTTITTTIKLYSGKTKTVKTVIIVK